MILSVQVCLLLWCVKMCALKTMFFSQPCHMYGSESKYAEQFKSSGIGILLGCHWSLHT